MRGPPPPAIPALLAFTALAALAMAAAPPGSAQAPGQGTEGPVPTTVFLHVNGFQDMAMNTQAPPESFAEDVTVGVATTSNSCVSTSPAVNSFEHHTSRGFGLLGHVDYSYDPPHPEFEGYGGGLLSDVHLVGEEMVLHWYWSTDAADPFDAGAAVPLVVPDVSVEATLREGQLLGIDGQDLDGGAILAHGRSEPATLAAEQSNGVTYEKVGPRHVYHFEVPMRIERPVIPGATGYSLRVDTFVLRDGCPSGGYLMPNVLALHTSPEHRPRLELLTSDRPSVDVVYAGPRGGPNATEGGGSGTVVVHANVSSPWGKGDIAAVSLSITGPGEASSLALVEPVQQAHCHCPPTPLQPTWLWDAAYDKAPPGTYEVTVTATNLQGTATTVATAPLDLRHEQAAPGIPAPLLLAGLAAFAALARRRA